MKNPIAACAIIGGLVLLAGCGSEAPKSIPTAPAGGSSEATPATPPAPPATPAPETAAPTPAAPTRTVVTVKTEGDAKVLGQVLSVEGEVSVLRQLQSLPLAENAEVLNRDRITTGPTASVELRLGSGNTILIQPNSAVILARENQSTSLELPAPAKVRCQLEGLRAGEEDFTVKTPVAVAGVRGTDFIADYNPDNAQGNPFALSVLSGKVGLQNLLAKGAALRETVVGQGQQQLLDKVGNFLPAQMLSQEGLSDLIKGNAVGDLRKKLLAEKLQNLKDKAQEKVKVLPGGAQDKLKKFLK